MKIAMIVVATFVAGLVGGILLDQFYRKVKKAVRHFWEAMEGKAAIALLIGAAIGAVIAATPADAQVYRTYCEYGNGCYRYRYDRWTHDWYRVHRLYYHPRVVYREEERRRDREDYGHCRSGDVVDALSDQHKSEDKARADAVQKWSAKVQWSHGGGEFMDFDLAADISWRCGPSDPGDTITGRFSRFTAKVTAELPGASHDRDPEGRNVRCQVWAIPCKGERDRDDRRR